MLVKASKIAIAIAVAGPLAVATASQSSAASLPSAAVVIKTARQLQQSTSFTGAMPLPAATPTSELFGVALPHTAAIPVRISTMEPIRTVGRRTNPECPSRLGVDDGLPPLLTSGRPEPTPTTRWLGDRSVLRLRSLDSSRTGCDCYSFRGSRQRSRFPWSIIGWRNHEQPQAFHDTAPDAGPTPPNEAIAYAAKPGLRLK